MYVKYIMWFHAKKSQPKHSTNQNSWIYNIIRAVQLRITKNNLKVGSRICNLLIFSLQYVCYLLGGTRWPGESSCLEDSEYVRKSWVESLGGQVTADWSDPYFKVKGQVLSPFQGYTHTLIILIGSNHLSTFLRWLGEN